MRTTGLRWPWVVGNKRVTSPSVIKYLTPFTLIYLPHHPQHLVSFLKNTS